jgi:hypothetical protein
MGFILGPIRVLWLVPRVGNRIAELLEMPLMLVTIVLAASWTNRRFAHINRPLSRLSIGLIALMLIIVAEIVVGIVLRGMSPIEILINRDPISGGVYYASLIIFAIMPWLLRSYRSRKKEEIVKEA